MVQDNPWWLEDLEESSLFSSMEIKGVPVRHPPRQAYPKPLLTLCFTPRSPIESPDMRFDVTLRGWPPYDSGFSVW